jgi:hypothetical protein
MLRLHRKVTMAAVGAAVLGGIAIATPAQAMTGPEWMYRCGWEKTFNRINPGNGEYRWVCR